MQTVATQNSESKIDGSKGHVYVVNLISSPTPLRARDFPILKSCRDRVYRASRKVGDTTLFALRLGLYESRDEAQTAVLTLRQFFPKAVVRDATEIEIKRFEKKRQCKPQQQPPVQRHVSHVPRKATVSTHLEGIADLSGPTMELHLKPEPNAATRDQGQAKEDERSLLLRLLTSATVGYLLVAVAIAVGWLQRDEFYISPENGLGYALGIIGSVGMLLLLLYPLRKRVRFMRIFGATRHWFRSHMILGVVGPTLVLFHSNFHLGSLNSTVALLSMLAVALSGLFGRYIYAGMHHGLYGKRRSLEELQAQVRQPDAESNPVLSFVGTRLHRLDAAVLVPPLGLVDSVIRYLRLSFVTRLDTLRLRREITKEIKKLETDSIANHTSRLRKTALRRVRGHFSSVRQVARFNMFERLFALWHVFHYPLFLILIGAAIIHVLAVHMY